MAEGPLGDRVPFRLVGFRQDRIGPPAQQARELPAQVAHVGDADVHANAARGRDRVRGIAGQPDPAATQALGDERVDHPVLRQRAIWI